MHNGKDSVALPNVIYSNRAVTMLGLRFPNSIQLYN